MATQQQIQVFFEQNDARQRGQLQMKRMIDVFFSVAVLLCLFPLIVVIALAIRLDSNGPVLYLSERIGRKGRAFCCMKFRTMVCDADAQRANLEHLNERNDVLFKISNDPRVTRIGKFLRKYSLDELPQFLNVLCGDMSIVGPRPPIAEEVMKYDLFHLHRLNVKPGITGLWQVMARQDPSFEKYIELDLAYVEQWTLWMDLRIMARTVGVVFAGTGR